MTTLADRLALPGDHSRILFLLLFLLCGTGLLPPAAALVLGCLFALTQAHPLPAESSCAARLLLQFSVVALGFGMDAREVLHAGRSGVLYTAVGITFAMTLGLLLGRLLRVRGRASFLITAGTSICGGSAIAALAPIVEADPEQIALSMATVFLLNAVALVVFPAVGFALHLTQPQFGLWAALAIHDTSSVVGAAAHYGPIALTVGTAVKLARALWIVPLSLLTAAVVRRSRSTTAHAARPAIPWFIAFFCAAALLNSALPALRSTFHTVTLLGRDGLTATLFLIGTGLSRQTLRRVGVRPLVQASLLWLIVGSVTLFAIERGTIHF